MGMEENGNRPLEMEWEWEYSQNWEWLWIGMKNDCMGMGGCEM